MENPPQGPVTTLKKIAAVSTLGWELLLRKQSHNNIWELCNIVTCMRETLQNLSR